jgi:hypothetical protein
VDAARELAQLGERLLELGVRALERPAGLARVAVEPLAGHAQGQRKRDEPLLGPVVEVALESLPLGVADLEQTRARAIRLPARGF